MKDELGGQIIKRYSYLKVNNDEDKKVKGTKKCIIKRKLKFEDYKNCLEAVQIENRINHLKKKKINVDSPKEFINNKHQKHNKDLKKKGTMFLLKIALSSDDDAIN